VLLLAGSILFFVAIAMISHGQSSSDWAPAAVLGALAMLPGAYVTFLTFGAWQGWRGYSFNDIPRSELI
jgi:uncharacterized membrane protein